MVPGQTVEGVTRDIIEALENIKSEDHEFAYKLTLDESIRRVRPPQEVSADEPIVKALANATETVTGKKPRNAGFWGWWCAGPEVAKRAKELGRRVVPSPTFGPGDTKLPHAVNERVDVKQLVDATKIYALTATDILY
jgi:succinyl-diaminopimelate desuccinylase